MPKRKTVLLNLLLIIFVFTTSLIGYWLWKTYFRETPPEEWDRAPVSPVEDYVLKETPQGTVIENKKAGLRFKVPQGWRVEKPKVEGIKFIKLWSPSAIELNTALIKKGCRTNISVTTVKTNLETLKKETIENLGSLIKNMEIITVGGAQGIKYRIQSSNNKLHHKEALILGKNHLYTFTIDAAPQDEKTCFSTFDQLLQTVSIEE